MCIHVDNQFLRSTQVNESQSEEVEWVGKLLLIPHLGLVFIALLPQVHRVIVLVFSSVK